MQLAPKTVINNVTVIKFVRDEELDISIESYYLCKCNQCGKEEELSQEDIPRYKCDHDIYPNLTINGVKVIKFAYIHRDKDINYYECECNCKRFVHTRDEILNHQ